MAIFWDQLVGVRSRSFSTVPAMARSPSFGSPLRIQELTPAPTPPMMEEKEGTVKRVTFE